MESTYWTLGILSVFSLCGGLAWAEQPSTSPSTGRGVTAPGAKVELLSREFKFTEGATCDAEGNVFFTDQPNDRIMKWSVDGKLSVFMQPAGRSNGMIFSPQGDLYSCADAQNELWLIKPDKKVTVLVKEYEGKLLNGPNDVWLRPDGGLYITDPFYKRDYWNRGPKEQEVEGVYYLPPETKADRKRATQARPIEGVALPRKLTRVIDDLKTPNGITGTPDGKILYVSDLAAQKTYAYDIQPDGSLTNKRLFCEMGSDGMTIDNEGNVYLTAKGVFVFDKTGQRIDHIEVPEPWSANVCFGGKDRKTLFITASKGLYAVKMRVQGVNQKGGK
ncbi:MAG TPA: SMP-30/gluconolactonase/LRE family protein [Phycisphaerae bacterium]|jgi:gluconolactonase|nr:SMP-30/gluconolactonase/LRE family protein [Phycisphaerae bacterium]HPU34888.1 SMP-30/gluconolactonase/LRE family protein [Phycisphaerae bacterium]HQA43683.1 SMP-30/gluconolactonase/LRE family protein [Phycisphaerae bacterium]HQE44458.1 SMP-30/gluconolactonase/LRE family protein [Phycisphaerae bacterium]HXK88148.1 SMP-30/gluconolactonase/LRE family protein [Phycisphaerae bacterium]